MSCADIGLDKTIAEYLITSFYQYSVASNEYCIFIRLLKLAR
jgi:hypothetical protein